MNIKSRFNSGEITIIRLVVVVVVVVSQHHAAKPSSVQIKEEPLKV